MQRKNNVFYLDPIGKYLNEMSDEELLYTVMFVTMAALEHSIREFSRFTRKDLIRVFDNPEIGEKVIDLLDGRMKPSSLHLNYKGISDMQVTVFSAFSRRFNSRLSYKTGEYEELEASLLSTATRHRIELDMPFLSSVKYEVVDYERTILTA